VVRVVALLAVAGCQLAFPEDPDEPPSACGSFRVEAEEQFDGLEDTVEFSVHAAAMTGFVKAKQAGENLTLIYPIKLVDGRWQIDDMRIPVGAAVRLDVLQMEEGLIAGRASPQGDLFGARVDLMAASVFSQVVHYQLSPNGNGWGQHPPAPTSLIAQDSTVPGGAAELPQQFGVIRQVPVLHFPDAGKHFVSVLTQLDDANDMTTDPWVELLDDGVLATEPINAAHADIEQAAMALGPNGKIVIAYEARDGGESRLFLTEKDGEQFPVGVHLDEIDGDGSEVEPFLSPDCQTLWFRRGGSIFRAVAVAASP
jgi:hypothetical protein